MERAHDQERTGAPQPASSQPSPTTVNHAPRPGHARLWQHQQRSTHPQSEESWIEVSSQPSSSSLSSSMNEESRNVRLGHQHESSQNRNRRRLQRSELFNRTMAHRASNTENSSPEEYEESESESEEDRVLSSSNEALPAMTTRQAPTRVASGLFIASSSANVSVEESPEYDEDDDEDENSTAIDFPRSTHSITQRHEFTPQPHAFSHPPAPHSQIRPAARQTHSDTYPPRSTGLRSSTRRNSYSRSQPLQHSPYNVISPSHQADHDAALRASLSTLLSCAAAARGLPKSTSRAHQFSNTAAPARVEPSTLRMVPESVALGAGTTTRTSSSPSPSRPNNGPPSAHKKQQHSSPTRARSSPSKKQRLSHYYSSSSPTASIGSLASSTGPPLEDMVSPTLLTWVLSAGVVVLVSAISFSAGYAAGRDALPADMTGASAGAAGVGGAVNREGIVGTAAGCAGEVINGIERGVVNASGGAWRRLRWGGGGATVA